LVALWTLAAPRPAIGEDEGTARYLLLGSFDYLMGFFPDAHYEDASGNLQTHSLRQSYYAVSGRLLHSDSAVSTPLGAMPSVWVDINLGYISGADGIDSSDADGGILWNIRLAGPWQLVRRGGTKLSAGVGFTMGVQAGLPAGLRSMGLLAFDAFVMALAEFDLGGVKALVEAEYASGAGYNEQRAYGHVALGKLAIGGVLFVGQSTTNYFGFGASLGGRFDLVQ
jgi:hypothetical protein